MKTERELFPPEFVAPALGGRVPTCSDTVPPALRAKIANENNRVPTVPTVPTGFGGGHTEGSPELSAVPFSPHERRAVRTRSPIDRALALMIVAERQGVRFRLDGEAGVTMCDPRRALTPELLAELQRHKAEIASLLEEARRDAIEERAAILDFDAGLSRREAERRAQAEHDGSAA